MGIQDNVGVSRKVPTHYNTSTKICGVGIINWPFLELTHAQTGRKFGCTITLNFDLDTKIIIAYLIFKLQVRKLMFSRIPEDFPEQGLDANYCRNPDNSEKPWCFTIDPNLWWEYCDISVCAGKILT